jgi:hypothetical protein
MSTLDDAKMNDATIAIDRDGSAPEPAPVGFVNATPESAGE